MKRSSATVTVAVGAFWLVCSGCSYEPAPLDLDPGVAAAPEMLEGPPHDQVYEDLRAQAQAWAMERSTPPYRVRPASIATTTCTADEPASGATCEVVSAYGLGHTKRAFHLRYTRKADVWVLTIVRFQDFDWAPPSF